MKWIESYNLIEMYKNDYGNSIEFDTFNFKNNDTIIVVFENNIIEPKIYNVSSDSFKFKFSLNKEEVQKFKEGDYLFSIKQYRNDEFLQTLINGTLRVKESIEWEH